MFKKLLSILLSIVLILPTLIRPSSHVFAATSVTPVTSTRTVETNSVPTISVDNTLDVNSINLKQGQDTFTLSGTLIDDNGDTVKVYATIGGIKKEILVSNTATVRSWTLSWRTSEFEASLTQSNIKIYVDDHRGGVSSAIYTGELTVNTSPIFYWDKFNTKEEVTGHSLYYIGTSSIYDFVHQGWIVSGRSGVWMKSDGSPVAIGDYVHLSTESFMGTRIYVQNGSYVEEHLKTDDGRIQMTRVGIKANGVKQLKDKLEQTNIQELDKTYPDDGVFKDGYWYVKKVMADIPPVLFVNSSDILVSETGDVILTGYVRKKTKNTSTNLSKSIAITATIEGIKKETAVIANTSAGEWTLTWSASELPPFGEYTGVQVTADDGLGGIDVVIYTGLIIVDRTNPSAPIIINDTNWSTKPIEVTIESGTDNESGVVKTEYKIGDGSWTVYTAPFIVTQEGEQQILARTMNKAGGSTEAKPSITRIVTTPPTAPTISLDKQGWGKDDVNVTIGESEGFSDLTYYYKIGNGDWLEGTTLSVSTEGATLVTSKTINAVGMESPEVTASVMIDKTAPVVSLAPNGSDWSTKPSSVSINVQDSISGVVPLSTQYALTKDTEIPVKWNVVPVNNIVAIDEQDEWYLHVKAQDFAGNKVNFISSPYKYQVEPAEPVLTVSSVESISAQLSWTLPLHSSTAGYTYEIVEASRGNWAREVYPTAVHTLSNLEPGSYYNFTVTARNHVGETSSNEVSFLTKPSSPDILAVDKVGSDASIVDISVSPVQSATGYHYVVRDVQSGGEVLNIVDSGTTYRIPGLDSGRRYNVIVSSINEAGESETSVVGFITLPAAPANFSAVQIFVDSIRLFWEPVESATGYDLYRKDDLIYQDLDTMYHDGNLLSGTHYSYMVNAENEMGEGGSSILDNIITLPSQVTGITPSDITQDSATIAWNSGSGVDNYTLEGTNLSSKTVSGDTNSVTLLDLTAGESYSIDITPSNESGSGASSQPSTFTTLPAQLDEHNLYVNDVEETSATIHFSGTNGATKYRIVADGVAYETSVTEYEVTGLTGGKKITYTVEAGNASGYSGLPVTGNFVTKPSQLTNVHLTNLTDSSFTLQWDKQGDERYKVTLNEEDYEAERKENWITVDNLPAGELTEISVIAMNDTGEGKPTILKVMTKQHPVTGIQVKVEDKEAIISYSPVDHNSGDVVVLDNNGVEVYRGKDNHIKLPITAGESYHYKIVVENGERTSSDASDIVFKALPQGPIGIKIHTIGVTDVTFDASKIIAKGIDSIVVYKHGKEEARFPTTVKYHRITGLTENKDYEYIFKGVNSSGESTGFIKLKFKTKAKPLSAVDYRNGGVMDNSAHPVLSESPEIESPFMKSAIPTSVKSKPTENPESIKYYRDLGASFAVEAINALTDLQIVKGAPGGMFEPNREITRIELATMLVRATKAETKGERILTFKDINQTGWYFNELAAAIENKIAIGFSEYEFKPTVDVNREQSAKMIANVLYNFYHFIPSNLIATATSTFIDRSHIATWAKESIDTLTSLSIMKGYPDGSFKPKQSLTRAESAELIYRMLKYNTNIVK